MYYDHYPYLHDVKKVLLIKLRSLGDVVLSTTLLRVLHHTYPHLQVHMYVYEEASSFFTCHPFVAKVWSIPRKKPSFFKRVRQEGTLLYQIYKEQYDLVINLTEGDRGALASLCSLASVRVGKEAGLKGLGKKISPYTHIVKEPGYKHMVEKELDVLRVLGISAEVEQRRPWLVCTEQEKALEPLFQKLGSYILIHPTSRWGFKGYPAELFRKVIQSLMKKKHKVLLTCSKDPKEKYYVQEVTKGLDRRYLMLKPGAFSLLELAAVIKRARLVVCVDSVALHLASTFQTPTVVLFGPTSPVVWGPWRNEQSIVVSQKRSCQPCYRDGCGGSKISDCLVQLCPQKVLQACFTLLDQQPLQSPLQSSCLPLVR